MHTKFPDYLKDLMGLPTSITNEFLKCFTLELKTLVNTPSHKELEQIGQNLSMETVDQNVFMPMLESNENLIIYK